MEQLKITEITLTEQEVQALMTYFLQIPTQWGREPVSFFEKKLAEKNKDTIPEPG